MALKKTIASYLKSDGSWEPQRDVDMHLLEENAMRHDWAFHEVIKDAPQEPSKEEEHEWLIEHGAHHVKAKREEFKKNHEAYLPKIEQAHKLRQDAHIAWEQHKALCVANGVDYDTFEGDARLKLKVPGGR